MSCILDLHTKPIYADIDARTIAKLTVALNSMLTIIALTCLRQDVNLYWSSFTETFQRTVLIENNYTDPLSIRQVLELSAPSSPHFHLVQADSQRMIIEYGTTWENWCWNDPLPIGLPSILRAIEFHSISQLLLRATFLWSLSVRPILGAFRSLAVYNRLSMKPYLSSSRMSLASSNPLFLPTPRRVSLLNRSVLLISPPISFLVLVAGFFTTAWQQDLDFHSVMWVPFYAFSALYILHMLLHTAIEMMEQERVIVPRVLSRFLLISVFIVTSVIVLRTHDAFLERKTCHVIVSKTAAIAEYLCLLTITIFSLLEWNDYWHLNIMAEDNGIDIRELDDCCSYTSSASSTA